jgi:hypothetical protein
MKIDKFVASGFLLSALSGCSYFTPPMEKPIIEDHSHNEKVTTFGMIPSRRMVIVKLQEKPGEPPIHICAEPSPDVSDNLASSLAMALSGKTPQDITLAASLSKSLATTAQHLFKRSQGLQLYRDGMYNLCQAWMNGIIDNTEYKAEVSSLTTEVATIIKLEIPKLYTSTTAPSSSSPSSSGPTATSNATITGGVANPPVTSTTTP